MSDHQLALFTQKEKKSKLTSPFTINGLQREDLEKAVHLFSTKDTEKRAPLIENSDHPLASTYNQLILGIRKYFERSKLHKAVIGLSGGIDSTLTLKLAVDALSPKNVVGMIMPELGLTSALNIEHAKKLCEYFEIDYYYVPINPFLMDFNILPWKPNLRSHMNTKARVRMSILYNFANTENALVLGTGNKSELMVGYGTKYGDMGCDLEVIGDLLKTEVWELSRYLELPEEIINKSPSAELTKDQTDEGEMGFLYKDLDSVLKYEKEGVEFAINKGISPPLAHKIFNMIGNAEHKTKTPPIIRIKR